ncbi:MAG TPA: hypothetical protein VFI55_11760 [Mycobacterium sp.]|nr:hypothetical protein [Mycobacterium sp.]
MAVQTMDWNWAWVFGGDHGYTLSHQYNFAPANCMAQTSLSVGSPGLGIIGFTEYVTRPHRDGADHIHHLSLVTADGGAICYPPVVYDQHLTGVTWVLECGGGLDTMAGSILMFTFG